MRPPDLYFTSKPQLQRFYKTRNTAHTDASVQRVESVSFTLSLFFFAILLQTAGKLLTEFSHYGESPMCIIKNGRAVSRSKRDDCEEEEAAGRFATHLIYCVHSGGKAQCCHCMMCKSERCRLNGSLARTHALTSTHAHTPTTPPPPPPSHITPNVFYLSAPLAIFS